MKTLRIIKPDDWHIHLRDGAMLQGTVQAASACFNRVLVMPNLSNPVTTVRLAKEYYQRIQQVLPAESKLETLMSLYLHESITVDTIKEAKASQLIYAVKMYPSGVTTNSASGVQDITKLYPILEAMEEVGLLLLIHGESADKDVDIFDRERVFIDQTLAKIVQQFPNLKIVLEHVSTKEGIDFVKQASDKVAATLTVQHMAVNRNQLLAKALNPHYYCFPILKREEHRQAVLQAAMSGSSKFFLGSDSAPHPKTKKESASGCGGIYTGYDTLALYAEIFEQANALDCLENFASKNGANFYGLPIKENKVTLIKEEVQVPSVIQLGNEEVVPYKAGEIRKWRTQEIS